MTDIDCYKRVLDMIEKEQALVNEVGEEQDETITWESSGVDTMNNIWNGMESIREVVRDWHDEAKIAEGNKYGVYDKEGECKF